MPSFILAFIPFAFLCLSLHVARPSRLSAAHVAILLLGHLGWAQLCRASRLARPPQLLQHLGVPDPDHWCHLRAEVWLEADR